MKADFSTVSYNQAKNRYRALLAKKVQHIKNVFDKKVRAGHDQKVFRMKSPNGVSNRIFLTGVAARALGVHSEGQEVVVEYSV